GHRHDAASGGGGGGVPPCRRRRKRAGACVHVPSPSGGEGGVRKRLFCSSHAVLRLRRERALEKVNEVR
ncbi:hypothetical protein T484DRAFT_1922471, partial [Baffinella frigidus]